MHDHQAEETVRQTMRELSSGGKRCFSQNVPIEAAKRLGTAGEDKNQAPERIHRAIKDMVARGELTAPIEPSETWRILCPMKPPRRAPQKNSSGEFREIRAPAVLTLSS